MTHEQLQIAKEITIAALDKIVFDYDGNNSKSNENFATEVARFYSKICDTIVENDPK